MDLVDMIVEKKFLGQEFLTWLWWKATDKGFVPTVDGDVGVEFKDKLMLKDSSGEESVSCTGTKDLPEAMSALYFGKKIQQAKILITKNDSEFAVLLTADLFEFKAVRLPKVAALPEATDDEQEANGYILDRVYLFRELHEAVKDLFTTFLDVRLGPSWGEELAEIRKWVMDGNVN